MDFYALFKLREKFLFLLNLLTLVLRFSVRNLSSVLQSFLKDFLKSVPLYLFEGNRMTSVFSWPYLLCNLYTISWLLDTKITRLFVVKVQLYVRSVCKGGLSNRLISQKLTCSRKFDLVSMVISSFTHMMVVQCQIHD